MFELEVSLFEVFVKNVFAVFEYKMAYLLYNFRLIE